MFPVETLHSKKYQQIFSGGGDQKSMFKDKSFLNTLSFPKRIVGREEKIEELLKHLIGYRQRYVEPLISVYGRSGSGKSITVKFVCNKLINDLEFCFVNLRQSKTVFGSANQILVELGEEQIKSAKGLPEVINAIGDSIISKLERTQKKTFILVLDEIDALFTDTRGKPSDFIYKLLLLEEKLLEAGFLMSIITISNNLVREFDLDDRVRSRIGNSEVFFEPYKQEQVLRILKNIAKNTFSIKIDNSILQKCAELSSLQHGDARRAIELLKIAAELAESESKRITLEYVTKADLILQKIPFLEYFRNASLHSKFVMLAIARLSFLTDEHWHATSRIYNQYKGFLKEKKLSYRRVSELLSELTQSGILSSHTKSSGRYGYGTQYELRIPPSMILKYYTNFEQLKKDKATHLEVKEHPKWRLGYVPRESWDKYSEKISWRKHVELEYDESQNKKSTVNNQDNSNT